MGGASLSPSLRCPFAPSWFPFFQWSPALKLKLECGPLALPGQFRLRRGAMAEPWVGGGVRHAAAVVGICLVDAVCMRVSPLHILLGHLCSYENPLGSWGRHPAPGRDLARCRGRGRGSSRALATPLLSGVRSGLDEDPSIAGFGLGPLNKLWFKGKLKNGLNSCENL